MALVKLECPSCNADLDFDESRDFCFCTFCGARLTREKQILELSGEVSVDGIAKSNALLERAFILIEDGNFSDADRCLERVLDQVPKCAKAYIGKFLCLTKRKHISQLAQLRFYICNETHFKNAIKFANDTERNEYGEIEQKNQEFVRNFNLQKQQQIDNLTQEKDKQVKKISIEVNKKLKTFNIAMISCAALFLISIVCIAKEIFGLFSLLLFVSFFCFFVFLTKRNTVKDSLRNRLSICNADFDSKINDELSKIIK